MPTRLDSTAPHIEDPAAYPGPLSDWGVIPTLLEGHASTSGVLLHRNPDGSAECGLWECTPGLWDCLVTRDEFCHFLRGRCTYTHESGEEIQVTAGTLAFFPRGWKGTCRVHETVRKAYMIR